MCTPYVVGVDEVGRGPIAGPVCVAAFVLFDYSLLDTCPAPLRDSKKLSQQKRDLWYAYLLEAESLGRCAFAHAFVSADIIDSIGIAPSIARAIDESLRDLKINIETNHPRRAELVESETRVLLDGGLRAPVRFPKQTTIIKGDEKEVPIMLASIVAKVVRDTYMEDCEDTYPGYDFHTHKGYGTKAHYSALAKIGLSPLHRKSFLGRIIDASKA
jgi:ribonuclease HII